MENRIFRKMGGLRNKIRITPAAQILIVLIVPVTISICSGCGLLSSEVVFQYPDVGFKIELPKNWEGYRLESRLWEGIQNNPETGDEVLETGPMVILHHPLSTQENPRQEIPIMVLSTWQWEAMMAQDWHIGAAPIAPLEIGRNSQYVFAVPARYNYAFLPGWEEVEKILAGQSITITEPQSDPGTQ